MKYCKETTLNHPISLEHKGSVEFINAIFIAEGYKKNIFSTEKAINLDKIEVTLCTKRKSPEPTMDMAIGLRKTDKNCRMLLIELKFNVSKPLNVKKQDIEGKIKHSIEILSQEIPIHTDKVFIFGDDQIQRARSYIAREFGNSPKNKVVVKTAAQFKADYFNP